MTESLGLQEIPLHNLRRTSHGGLTIIFGLEEI
jgi:hypothetical protein